MYSPSLLVDASPCVTEICPSCNLASNEFNSFFYLFLCYFFGLMNELALRFTTLNPFFLLQGSSVPLVVKWADTEKERLARRAQKAQSQASTVTNTESTQQPSLFGALPMGYIPPYNGYGYQVHFFSFSTINIHYSFVVHKNVCLMFAILGLLGQ